MIDPYVAEWLGLLGRWFHLTMGIAWIGASFYFVWLNNAVRPPEDPAPGVAGNLWAVHGGAFYQVQKYGGVPPKLPTELHWFQWEAYLTWFSGLYLMVLVYWLNPAMMVSADAPVSHLVAVGIGIATMFVGYGVYDGVCRTLASRPTVLAAVLAGFVAIVAWALFQVLSPRAAYLHVGAMLGTWMAANVGSVIIPGQRAMVDAMIAGRPPPTERGKAGALRSLHNNYLTLPVLFVMVSGHFPSTWGHPYGWLVLLGIAGAGVMVRHAINVAERGAPMPWLWPAAIVGIVAVAVVARPVAATAVAGAPAVSMVEVQTVITNRCLPCHAEHPTLGGYAAPPKGVVLDSPSAIRTLRESIRTQVVQTRAMPLGNLTHMTDEERALIDRWTAE
jgi:uncharacterized membrane protein